MGFGQLSAVESIHAQLMFVHSAVADIPRHNIWLKKLNKSVDGVKIKQYSTEMSNILYIETPYLL